MISLSEAARAYASGVMKAAPRVIGAERPLTLFTVRQLGAITRAAFKRGAKFQRTGK